jgi:hypothetical protein
LLFSMVITKKKACWTKSDLFEQGRMTCFQLLEGPKCESQVEDSGMGRS